MFISELELLAQGSLKWHDFSHLRTGVTGGSPIPPSLRLKLHNQLHLADLASCYGLTESSPIVSMTLPTDTLEQKLHTVGQVLPHTSIRIASRSDPTKTVQRYQKGELLISGYCVMNGYWKDEVWTSKTLVKDKEGTVWLRTGDEAMIDGEGYIKITGRIKDIIIRGGENIYPPEIENVLLQHPGVANASIVGVSDEKYGEVVAAFVTAKEGFMPHGYVYDASKAGEKNESSAILEKASLTLSARARMIDADEVRDWVRARMNRMLVPKYVFWVDRMPLTASGKVEKYKLRSLGEMLL